MDTKVEQSVMSRAGTGGDAGAVPKRRYRSLQEKVCIVRETLEPGSSVSIVARRHDVNANLLFNWRRQYREGSLGKAAPDADKLLPIVLRRTVAAEPASRKQAAGKAEEGSTGTLHIEFPGGQYLSTRGVVDRELLCAAIRALSPA